LHDIIAGLEAIEQQRNKLRRMLQSVSIMIAASPAEWSSRPSATPDVRNGTTVNQHRIVTGQSDFAKDFVSVVRGPVEHVIQAEAIPRGQPREHLAKPLVKVRDAIRFSIHRKDQVDLSHGKDEARCERPAREFPTITQPAPRSPGAAAGIYLGIRTKYVRCGGQRSCGEKGSPFCQLS
jgi:hypothetical protein